MNVRGLGILLLKVWGLASLAWGSIGVINTAILRIAPPGAEESVARYVFMTTALSAILQLGLGVVLLLSAHRIVAWIEPESDVDHEEIADTHRIGDLQSVVFGGVGVFFAIGALRDIAELVYTIARHPEWDEQGEFGFLLQTNQQELAGASVQLIAAIILILNRSALASLWSRIRPMASERDNSND